MADQPPGAGFNPHVWGQLNDAASQTNQRPRGGRGRGPSLGSRQGPGYGTQPPSTNPYAAPMSPPFQSPPPSMDSFPPLGSQAQPAATAKPMSPVSPQAFNQPPSRGSTYHRAPPRDFYHRGPSSPHGYGHHGRGPHFNHNSRSAHQQSYDNFRRPPAPGGNLYSPTAPPASFLGPFPSYDDKERAFREQVMAQSDYLNKAQVATRQKYQLKQDEQILKEDFRRHLESIFQQSLAEKYPSIAVGEIRLRCYGSLNNGFGLAQCDMDLLLALPEEIDLINKDAPDAPNDNANPSVDSSQQQGAASAALEAVIDPETDDDKFEVALRLEGALLDLGIGARLLTKTRVPILRVCERPNEELLENLRAYRKETLEAAEALKEKTVNQHADTPPDLSMSDIASALQELSSEEAAAQVILPASPSKNKQPSLEFTGDCGIQCDINFTNFVAIHNTRLLREYCLYDSRVAQIGTFVKAWAKIRDINTPYWGTLSSYGYILMVLHYLMNVAQPPVIPNLQDLAITQDSWNPEPVPKFEGKFDIRFWQDQATIEAYKAQQPRNRESTGHLLRGFFWYYSAREGFNFKNDVISIRSRGGILKKYHKGWTEAKWADQKKNVRQRYLLAIEDPFEVDHNVARVVGHNGIVAIRDEFRRAWSIISSVGGPNASTEDLLDVVEERGDLLRKDQEHHREKIRRMKQDLEAKEKEALKGVSMQNDQHEGENQEQIQQQPPGQSEKIETGTLDQTPWSHPSPPSKPSHRRRSPNPQLTQDDGGTQVKPRHLKRGRTRKVKAESDNEDHDEDRSESVARIEAKTWQRSGDVGELKAEGSDSDSGPICSPSETCLRQGFDSNGNPIAWDISTQDGRWLQWRDNKIRQGRWRGVVNNPSLAAHDKRYPFDPRRPAPEDCDEYRLANELFWVNRAPYPLNRNPDITSTETAIVAAIPKPGVIIRTRQKGRRRVVKRKSSSPTPTGHEQSSGQAPAVASEIPEQHGVKTDTPAAINESDDWAKRAEAWHQDTDKDTASSQGPVKPDEAATEAWAEIAQPAQPHPEAWDAVGFEESHTETDPRDSKGDGWGTPPSWKSTTMDVETASICTNPYPNEGPYCPNDNTNTSKEFRSTFKGSTPPQRHWRGTRHTSVDSDMITRAQRARALSGPHLSNTLLTGDARLDPQDWWQPVGLPIAWDISTAGGTWLRKRDTYIRLGTFQYPRGPHLQALHKLFPYDSRMPRWKLATYNAQLQAFYRYSLWPQGLRPPISSASRGQRGGSSAPEMNIIQPKVSTQTTIVTDSEEWPQYSLLQRPPPHSKAADFVSMFSPEDLAHKPREADSVVSDEAEEMPDSAFIRSRRLAYFADKEQRENGDDEAEDEETIRNIMMFMQQAGIGSGNGISDGSMHRRVDPTSMANYKPYSEQPGSGVGSMTTAEQNSFSTSFDPACEAEGMPKHPSVNAEETSKVPLTLYPDISANDRPRDEDPRIMPIPRDQGFKFDVRQLRDLAVIKEGGNGCAVQGCEFEIEGEHEWTGSGAVDWVQSDFAYEESKVSMEKPYEYGRGDEEGYLDELPGMGI